MRRVLLASPYPYTQTSRGMDIMTLAFEQSGWETHHLVFPNVFYTVKKEVQFPTSVIEHKAGKTHIPYVDSMMKKLPSFIFRWLVRRHQAKVRNMEWEKFDAVVLESGKPLFLLDLIRKETRLIYRQSDSVRSILGKNPSYIGLEDQIIKQGHHIIVIKQRFKDEIPGEHHEKVLIIRNGYSIPEIEKPLNPYDEDTKNAIYLGLTDLDAKCIRTMCKKNPDINFHFFGAGLKRIKKKTQGLPNLINHEFTSLQTYYPYLVHANTFVFPFKRNDPMKIVGLTSKFFMAMHIGLPIVCYRMEPREEFQGLPVDFCDGPEEFAEKVKEVTAENVRRTYLLPWDELKHSARLDEYKEFIEKLTASI